jgi:RNA polymerase sporulation-specific sigma factor
MLNIMNLVGQGSTQNRVQDLSGTGTHRPTPTYNVKSRGVEDGMPREAPFLRRCSCVPGLFAMIALFIKQLSLLVSYVKNNAFPQPLTEEDEAKHLKLMAEGNQESRNILIEHNLRLVAHIVNTL